MSDILSICKPCEKKLLETKDLNEHFGTDIVQTSYKGLLGWCCPGFCVNIYGSKISMCCSALFCLLLFICCLFCGKNMIYMGFPPALFFM